MIAISGLKTAVVDAGRPLTSSASSAAKPEGSVPFGGVLQSLMAQSNTLGAKAEHAVTGLLSGSGMDVHEAMIATQKADIAFELALQVRNKAVGAYQQMMAMQF